MIADIAVIEVRKHMLPDQPLPEKVMPPIALPMTTLSTYQSITARNIFSSKGVIPPELRPEGEDPNKKKELPPIPSQLPLNLVGTLVHSNPEKSIAAIELRGKNQTLSYTVGRDIDNMARVEHIERQVIFIRNLNSQRLEYLEIKSTSKLAFDSAPKPLSGGKQEVQKTGENKFSLKRSDVLKYTSDLSSVLMQARAVPARRQGTGEVYGWKLQDIQPNSIYTQLGLQAGDVITGVNGAPVTNVQQAMEMYRALKDSPNIKIQLERPNGAKQEYDYNVE